MDGVSPSGMVKRLDTDVGQTLRKIDISELNIKLRTLLANLRQDLADARIYSSAYELSETREEQVDNAKKAKRYLSRALKNILAASEYDIFSAIDVAQLSAQIDQIKDGLQ